MEVKTAAREFPEISLRVECIFFIPAAYVDSRASHHFEDIMEDLLNGVYEGLSEFKKVFGDVPEWLEEEWEYQTKETIMDYLSEEKQGFVAEFATPVRRFHTSETGEHAEYSWGRYRTQWIYGETIEELFEAGMKWFDKEIEEQRTRYQEKESA